MVRSASHELANPLMVVIARLELLYRTQQFDACGRTHLEAALAAADEIKKKVYWLTTRDERTRPGAVNQRWRRRFLQTTPA